MNEENKFQIALMQLQRSALIDTQTLFQILIEKGLCTIEDVTTTRQKIELNDINVRQLDAEIAKFKEDQAVVNDFVDKLRNILGNNKLV